MANPKKNDRLLKALNRQPVDKTPVWIMRQAGRYLPEYRETRTKAGNFMTLCQTPDLACEVTLQPLRRYDLDAAILFSDILTIPDAMGLGLYFTEGEGPKFKHPLKTEKDIQQLTIPNTHEKLNYVLQAIQHIQKELNNTIPLIGFSGSPWTLATYMIEGGSSKNFATIKKMLYDAPQTLHLLLDKLAQSVSEYLTAQIETGVDVIQIFDTWGGILTTEAYQNFSLNYLQKIVTTLKNQPTTANIPIILFTKGSNQWLEQIAQTGCQAVGLDWTIDINEAKKRIGHQVALQGNLDPCVLYANPQTIKQEVKKILNQYGKTPGHIFNLGHGIHPKINPDHMKILIDTVHEQSTKIHTQ